MPFVANADDARVNALAELSAQLQSALDLSERVEEFLLTAQIALALDTVRGAQASAGVTLETGQEFDLRAG